MKLLIAEDEVLTLGGLQRLDWEKIGIDEIYTVRNGTDAIKLVSSNQIDVLLTDIEMPNISGLELAKHIHKEHINTKVIILSGYDNFSYAQEAIKYRVSEYLLKPCSPKNILDCVKRVIESIRLDKAERFKEFLQETQIGLSSDALVMKKIYEYIERNFMNDISLSSLSEDIGYSSAYLSRLIKEKSEYTFSKLITIKRMLTAAELLSNTDTKVYLICEKIGINDQRYFSQLFKRTFGMTPLEYRQSNQKENMTGLSVFISNSSKKSNEQ